MLSRIEMQYMDAVIQMNRRQKANDIDWEQRRYEIAKSALTIAALLEKDQSNITADKIAENSVRIADALLSQLVDGELPMR